MITYCETSVKNEPTELRTKQLSEKELTTLYKNASSKELLFSTSDSVGLLRDDETDYYIALT